MKIEKIWEKNEHIEHRKINRDNKKFTLQRALFSIMAIGIMGFMFVLWVIFLYPMVENNLQVWVLFLIFYVLIISFWMTFFIGLFGLGLKSVKGGIILSIISAIFDLYYPPFSINLDGSLTSSESAGYKGSIDYTFGYYLTRVGLNGTIIFVLVYLIIPILILTILLLLLKPKKFKQYLQSI